MKRFNLQLERILLSRKLGSIKRALSSPVPDRGWIRAIREALGMSARQLGQRIGLKQTHVTRIEQGEIRGTTTVNTLKKMANGLDCELVYAFVPRNSLEVFLETQARQVADTMVRRTAHSMTLEDQKTSNDRKVQQIKEITNQLIKELPRNLWDYK